MHDSVGLWIIGAFNVEQSLILSPQTHCCAGARHPTMTDIVRKSHSRGFKGTSYKPPAPEFMDDDAHADCRHACWHTMGTRRVFEAAALAAVHGIKPWNRVSSRKEFFSEAAPTTQKIPITHPDLRPATTRALWTGRRTLRLDTFPTAQEILADARRWDPWGHRWGRGARWPLIVSIGRGRFRSATMLAKRKVHQ